MRTDLRDKQPYIQTCGQTDGQESRRYTDADGHTERQIKRERERVRERATGRLIDGQGQRGWLGACCAWLLGLLLYFQEPLNLTWRRCYGYASVSPESEFG